MTIHLNTTINGRSVGIDVDPTLTLLEVLRENLFLSGTKEGCGVGECGTCIVLVDGEAVTSCLVLAGDAAGVSIETVEGLAQNGELNEVQRARRRWERSGRLDDLLRRREERRRRNQNP